MAADSQVVSQGACPRPACGSSDAYTTYDDGHAHCFSCGTHWDSAGAAPAPAEKERRVPGLTTGTAEAIPNRKIDLKTAEKFGYLVGTFGGKKCHIAQFQDAAGHVVAQKVRLPGKEFVWLGDRKQMLPLFGQAKWRDAGRMVVITEGELDALSAAQAMGLTWPVVSIPDGAPNGAKAVAKAAPWLEQFERVVLMFDNDDAGREAAEECARLLSPGKAYIASLPLKDANEMLKAGRSKEIVNAAWDARQYRPDGIRTVADMRDEAMSPPSWGYPFPWPTLTRATFGIRRGELHLIGAGVGAGKTTAFKQMMAATMVPELIEDHGDMGIIPPEPRKVGALLLEEKPGRKTLKTIAGIVAGKRFHVPTVEFDPAELAAAIDRLDGLFFAYDHFGAKDWESIKPLITYMVLGLGIKDIYLDHLTALVAGAEDERRELDSIMADMASLVEQLDFSLFVISHLTTPTGTPHEEGGRVMEKHFTGSRAIARWAHNMHGMERDKQSPDAPTTWRVLKERETGDGTGVTFGLTYDRDTGRLLEVPLDTGFKDETTNADI